jgi:hypothetical protein
VNLPMIIPGQFGFNCTSGFKGEAFWNIFPIGSNDLWENVQMSSFQKLQIWSKLNCTWMFIGWSSTNFRFFQWSFLGSLVSIIQVVSEKRFETFFP